MVLDDRDRSFEKALARRVRANASAAACPDAETLAAYHERSLAPEELHTWERHIAACVNCKEILAQLEATDEIPVSVDQRQTAAVEGSNLFEAVYVGEERPVGAPLAVTAQRAAAVVSLPQNPKHPRAAHWRWLAPAGALAAGLLVWVAVHERQPAKVMQPAKIEVAENRPSASPPPVSTNATIAAMDREKSDKPASSSKATAATDNRASTVGELKNRRSESTGKVAGASREGDFEKSDRKDADLNEVAQVPSVSTESVSVSGVAGAEKSKQTSELPMRGRGVNNLTQLRTSSANPPAGGPTPLPQMESKTMKKAPPAAAAPETSMEISSELREAPAFRMAKSRSPRPVPAPGGKIIWRLGAAGLVEQSSDSGLTWTTQTSGTTADLFLGSATSENVCWVIGDGGTILRTEDGGAHWLPVVSPISQNLALIRASDALHAIVWDSSRRHSFQTEDGGATWTQVTGQ